MTIEDFVELVDCSNDNLDAVAAVLIYMQIYLNERFEGPKTYDVMLLPAQSQQVVRCLVSLDFVLSMKSQNEASIKESLAKVLDNLNYERSLIRPQTLLSLLVQSRHHELALLIF